MHRARGLRNRVHLETGATKSNVSPDKAYSENMIQEVFSHTRLSPKQSTNVLIHDGLRVMKEDRADQLSCGALTYESP